MRKGLGHTAVSTIKVSSVTLYTLYTVDATEYVTAQIDATFHEGRGKWRAIS